MKPSSRKVSVGSFYVSLLPSYCACSVREAQPLQIGLKHLTYSTSDKPAALCKDTVQAMHCKVYSVNHTTVHTTEPMQESFRMCGNNEGNVQQGRQSIAYTPVGGLMVCHCFTCTDTECFHA